MRHLLSIYDLSRVEIESLIDRSFALKDEKRSGRRTSDVLRGKPLRP